MFVFLFQLKIHPLPVLNRICEYADQGCRNAEFSYICRFGPNDLKQQPIIKGTDLEFILLKRCLLYFLTFYGIPANFFRKIFRQMIDDSIPSLLQQRLIIFLQRIYPAFFIFIHHMLRFEMHRRFNAARGRDAEKPFP